MANKVPERLINFKGYVDAVDLIGIVDVTLPNLEAMTGTVSGAGIGGEVETPTLGQYASQTLTINYRTVTKDAMKLAKPKAHSLDFRGSQQVYDAGEGQYTTQKVRVSVLAVPKNTNIGQFAQNSTTDSSNEFEVNRIAVFIDDEEAVLIDKFNNIARFFGEDVSAQIRRDMGQ